MTVVARLRSALDAPVFAPGDPGYDEARRVQNGRIDHAPVAVVRCRSESDVARALPVAVGSGLPLSIRGGGHDVAGRAVADGGVMLDLRGMDDVRVDASARTAVAGGGATWAQFNAATHAAGLATTGGAISTTGVAGLSLGGGLGWLMGRYGLAVDNLRSARIVTAAGVVLHADERSEPDLFWAIRGAGANFGVVTSLEFDLHPVASVVGGVVGFDLADAGPVFDAYRTLTADLPDELVLHCTLAHSPDGSGRKLVAPTLCDCGGSGAGRRAADVLLDAAPVVIDAVAERPYPEMNTLLDAGYPRGARSYWKSGFLEGLPVEATDVLARCFGEAPSTMSSILVQRCHGAATRPSPDATAYPHRAPGYNLMITAQWRDPEDDELNIGWATATFAAMQPFMSSAVYMNYLDRDDDGRTAEAYGVNLPRLIDVKRRYDPANVFRLNPNVDPDGVAGA